MRSGLWSIRIDLYTRRSLLLEKGSSASTTDEVNNLDSVSFEDQLLIPVFPFEDPSVVFDGQALRDEVEIIHQSPNCQPFGNLSSLPVQENFYFQRRATVA